MQLSSKAVRPDINALAAGPSATVRLRMDVRHRAHRQARPCGCGILVLCQSYQTTNGNVPLRRRNTRTD